MGVHTTGGSLRNKDSGTGLKRLCLLSASLGYC